MENGSSAENESLEEYVHVINLPSYPLNVDYIPPQTNENESISIKQNDLQVICCSYPTEKIEDKSNDCGKDKNGEIQIIHKSQSFRFTPTESAEPSDCTPIQVETESEVQNISKNASKTSLKTTQIESKGPIEVVVKAKICKPEVKKSDLRVHDNEKHLQDLFQDPSESSEMPEIDQLKYDPEENGLEDLLNNTCSSSNSQNVNYTQSESNLDMYKTPDLGESKVIYSQSEGGDCNFFYEDQILDSIADQNEIEQVAEQVDDNVLHYQFYYPENANVIEPVPFAFDNIDNNYSYNCTCCSELSPPLNVNGFNYIELPQQVRHFCNQNNYMRNCIDKPKPNYGGGGCGGGSGGGGGDFFFQSCERNLTEEKLYRKEILKIKAEERIKFQDEQFLTKNMKYRETTEYGHKSIWDRKKPEQQDQPEQCKSSLWKYSKPKSGIQTQTVMNFSVSLDITQPQKGIYTDLDSKQVFFRNFKGPLNVERSKYFSIDPQMIKISKFEVGKKYSFSLTVLNNGKAFRRYSVVQPDDNCFDVQWGSVIGQASTLSSGMRAKIQLDFKPKSLETGNYFLTVLVQGDGGIIVPISVKSGKTPILIVDELDCGCSNVGNPKFLNFEYINIGHPGRFWILTEDEFQKEYLGIGKEVNGNDNKEMTNVLISKPFKVYPSCFQLEKDQKILINVFFLPSKEQNFYQKLAILCDNTEVRWIALRGSSFDSQNTKFIEISAPWSGPPCDLPSEIGLKRALDFGDVLSMNESVKQSVSLRNNSVLPVYFFWSVRPLSCGSQNKTFDQNHESLKMFEKSIEESTGPSNLTESEDILRNNRNCSYPPLRILPSHALIDPGQRVDCDVVIQAGEEFGYHSCAISLFTQYPDDTSMNLIKEMLCSDFLSLTSPILFSDLLKSMPQKEQLNNSSISSITTKFEEFDPATDTIHFKFEPQPIYYMSRIIDENEDPETESQNQLRYNLKQVQNEAQNGQIEAEQIIKEKIGDSMNVTLENTEGFGSQSALKPFGEIELWYRSIPLNCWFEPAILIANGYVKEKVDRTFTFFNESEYPVQINWEKEINGSYSLAFEPSEFVVGPHETSTFRISIHFHKYGKISKNLKSIVNLPIMTTFINLPLELESFGPSIDILTPAINFGLLSHKSEGIAKMYLSNPGNHNCKWRANIISMPNGESKESKVNRNFKPDQELDLILKKSVKIWPEWGILNPGEVSSSKVYFFAEVQGSFSGAIEVILDENPEFRAFIPLICEVQSPTLILKNSKISLDINRQRQKTTCFPTLINPNSIPLKFAWLQPIGRQKDICHISIVPSFGIVPEHSTFECGMNIWATKETHLTNLFVPCAVEGQEIPLLLKITGNIFEPNVGKDANVNL